MLKNNSVIGYQKQGYHQCLAVTFLLFMYEEYVGDIFQNYILYC